MRLSDSLNHFCILKVCHIAEVLRFSVCDKDHAYAEKIGEVKLLTQDLLTGDTIEGWFPITTNNGGQNGENGELRLSVQYVPLAANPLAGYDVSINQLFQKRKHEKTILEA